MSTSYLLTCGVLHYQKSTNIKLATVDTVRDHVLTMYCCYYDNYLCNAVCTCYINYVRLIHADNSVADTQFRAVSCMVIGCTRPAFTVLHRLLASHNARSIYSYDVTPGDGATSLVPVEHRAYIVTALHCSTLQHHIYTVHKYNCNSNTTLKDYTQTLFAPYCVAVLHSI